MDRFLNFLVDFLVNLDGGQIIAIVLAAIISGVLTCIVLAIFLSVFCKYIYKMSVAFLNFPLKLIAIYKNDKLVKSGKRPIRYRIKNDGLFMDDSETDLPHQSTSKNLSDGDTLPPDNDELEDDTTIMDLSNAIYALKKYFKQHDNKKDK